ncbi:sialate O-acetylesterase [Akkermansiaceae bacterium]|nr:sialate O-acetylesterase [Akkermansiaceae bacterium]MDB4537901.1 sialate O-acetylesterase [Akkermansiaceae bacterium]
MNTNNHPVHTLYSLFLIAAAICFFIPPVHAEPPVKIYLLVGQSNMQGKGAIEGEGTNTLRHIVQNDTGKEYQFLVKDDGEWVEREDVWIYLDQAPGESKYNGLKPGYGSSGGQIGPELGFGHKIGDAHEGQVLVIKACWGGKSLGHNFLPPSVGKYPTPLRPGDPGFYYHEILRIVKDVTENIGTYFPAYKGQGMELAGLGWHQGWNDQYGGLDANYETNLAAFIKDIRSAEHGLGVPNLPVVIATSGMIESETPIKQGQLAMGDRKKHPRFAGNVAVVDTDKPYGPDKMAFKFYLEGKPKKVGYHWNNHARSYLNIGRAMAAEMRKLDKPAMPSRFTARGSDEGVQLNWQLGSERPKSIEIFRNGNSLGGTLSPTQTTYLDTTALPGTNIYELVLNLPAGKQNLNTASDTSVTKITAYRGLDGVMLSWEAQGKYEGFRITRDGKVIADALAADARRFEDKQTPGKGKVTYVVEPTSGKVTPASLVVNLGPADPGSALLYEPFDYPGNPEESLNLVGKGGAHGTKGSYVYLSEKNPERVPATEAEGLSYGVLPVTGNRGSTHRWSAGGYIQLDGSLNKAGLLQDGATLWMSYVFTTGKGATHRQGGGIVTLRSEDMKEGVGFKGTGRQYETIVVLDGKEQPRRITGTRPNTPILVVGRITWGKDGGNDSFVPFHVGPDLKLPEKEGRHSVPFNIDQSKLSRLVLGGEGQFDEIRVGPTFESVVGGGAK